MHPLARFVGLPPEGAANLDFPLWGGSEHDLEERSDAQIIVSRFPAGGASAAGD